MPIAWLLLALLLSACTDAKPLVPTDARPLIRVRAAPMERPAVQDATNTMRLTTLDAALDSPEPAERERAVLDFEGDLARLAPLATDDASADVRRAAVQRLADGERPLERAALRHALGDRDPSVVVEAILALSTLGDTGAIPALERLHAHPDPEVRALADEALGGLRP